MNQDIDRNLTWKLNWYRQSELEGALLLGRLVALVKEPKLARQLTAHAADEARHSQLWAEAIDESGYQHVRIFRSYQSLYRAHGGTPSSLIETLVFTHIFEKRVHKPFISDLSNLPLTPPVRAAFKTMINDEKDHLGWVSDWLKDKTEAPELLKKYRVIDRNVYQQLEPYTDCIFNLPGLGEEIKFHP